MNLSYASMFTGIGGFDLALDALGWDCKVQVEWDEHCQTILRRSFPGTKLMGDIKNVRATDLGRPDVVVGGFPCQDTALAAPNRLGLAGARSGHFIPFIELIDESISDGHTPEWLVIENPDGLLTSPGVDRKTKVDRRGWDMAAVTTALADLGYGWSYRVVDGRYLGSTFRRRRVILVGHSSGDPLIPARVLGNAPGGPEALAAYPVGANGQVGPSPYDPDRPHRGDDRDVYRKSARPRASLSKGGYETWVNDGRGNTLSGFDWGLPGWATHMLPDGNGLRIPTILEWERGLGFPDHWTAGVPISSRGQMVGNSMQVGMAWWAGSRLEQEHAKIHRLVGVA